MPNFGMTTLIFCPGNINQAFTINNPAEDPLYNLGMVWFNLKFETFSSTIINPDLPVAIRCITGYIEAAGGTFPHPPGYLFSQIC